MSEMLGGQVGLSKVEKNIFACMGEFTMCVFALMMWLLAKMMNQSAMDTIIPVGVQIGFFWFFIVTSAGLFGHFLYILYLAIILKRDETIKELSGKGFKLNIYIVPEKKIILRTRSARKRKPKRMETSQDQVNRVLSSSMLTYISKKLVQKEIPGDLNLDMVFKMIHGKEYWGDIIDRDPSLTTDLVPDDKDFERFSQFTEFADQSEKLATKMVQDVNKSDGLLIEDLKTRFLEWGPKKQIEEFFEAQDKLIDKRLKDKEKNKKKLESYRKVTNLLKAGFRLSRDFVELFSTSRDPKFTPFLYLYDQPLKIDKEMSFRDLQELSSKEIGALSELDKLFGGLEPQSAIIWRPDKESDKERKIWKFNDALQDYIPSYIVEMDLFYLGSIAGIPILLDILTPDHLDAFYEARVSIAELNNLKLKALTFLLVALSEQWDRIQQDGERKEMYSKVSQLQQDMTNKMVKNFINNIKDSVNDRKREFQVVPKKVDLTHFFMMFLGVVLGGGIVGLIWGLV